MFFAPSAHRFAYGRPAFDSLFDDAFLAAPSTRGYAIEQDDKAYTVTFDMPGVAKEQLTIGIEGSIVRIETKADAPRRYKGVYELPQDIDVAASDAKLENGVLTLKLAKKVPVAASTQLVIN